MRRFKNDDRGIAAIWMAITFLFIIGAAAIAVDASGAYNTARTDQTTADLACLAGVKELPDSTAAINQTINYTVANWPSMAGNTPTIVGTTATYTDGNGNSVAIDAQYGGDPKKMHVSVTEQSDSFFGKALGADALPVSQEAYCRALSAGGGVGILPIGVLPGGFGGDLFGPAPCSTGNCGGLDFGSGASDFEGNLATGVDRALTKHHGLASSVDPDSGQLPINCDSVGSGESCSKAKTKTGQMAGPLGQGLIERFKNDPGATCTFTFSGNILNCDSPTQILGAASTPLFSAFGSQPSWWVPSLYGPWTALNTMQHVYYDGVVAKCDSPRLSQVPIVVENNDWNIGDPNSGTWPNGSKEMKIIGFHDVIIKDPNDNSDFQGSGTAKRISADIAWFGPNAICSDGSPVGVLNGIIGKGENRVFLVDDTN